MADDCWVVGMYLGNTELVGGKDDGESRHTNFEFDLSLLIQRFSRVDRCFWSAFPAGVDDEDTVARSFVTVEGFVGENPLRVQIHSL